jgi:hypothetical protein
VALAGSGTAVELNALVPVPICSPWVNATTVKSSPGEKK